jgi:diacylglycerol kinase family enzyme
MQQLTRPDYAPIPYLSVRRVKNVQIRLNRPLPTHMDGEIIHEEELNLDIHIQPACLPVICGL